MQIAISVVIMLVLFVGIPLCLVCSLRRRSLGEFMYGRRGERRSMSAIGSSLLELDRLLSRPAVEYRVKMDDQAQAVKDEHGGE
jgi:hypothetical protein